MTRCRRIRNETRRTCKITSLPLAPNEHEPSDQPNSVWRGRLVQANTRDGTHFPHELGHINARRARVRGPDSEAAIVCDHLGQNVQDGLR